MPADGAIRAAAGVTLERKPRRRYGMRSVFAATGLLVGAVAVTVAAPGVAGASTLDGVANIASPGTTNSLTSGGSETEFTLSLPPQAACSGDTETDGYHVFSYLVEPKITITGITFPKNLPNTADNQYGFVNNAGEYYGAANTAPSTGQIIEIPNDLEFGPLVSDGLVTKDKLLYGKKNASGVWVGGLACTNSSGTVTDYWTTNITFTASKSDPNGFVWSAFQFTSSSTLNPAKIGSAYTDTVTAAGGTTPYKWKATGLPKGLKMSSSTGTISGTASKKDKAKAYPISVTCTDKAKAIATGTFSLTLDAA